MRRSKKISRRIKIKTNKRRNNRHSTKKFRKHTKKIFGGETEAEIGRRKRGIPQMSSPVIEETLEQMSKRVRKEKKIQAIGLGEEVRAEEISDDKFKQLHASLSQQRTSKRGQCSNTFVPKDVVPGKVGYNAAMPQVSLDTIKEFVKTQIKPGPQLVTLPVGGMSHIILVDVQPDKIMISDWRGRKFIDGENPSYENYKQLMSELETKYGVSVQFYFLDPVLLEGAEEKSISLGKRGGCSEYAYAWSDLYYKQGYYEWPFNDSPPDPEHYPFIHLLYDKAHRFKHLL
jgi:hypothetical protein